jgi:hypothetical protein
MHFNSARAEFARDWTGDAPGWPQGGRLAPAGRKLIEWRRN